MKPYSLVYIWNLFDLLGVSRKFRRSIRGEKAGEVLGLLAMNGSSISEVALSEFDSDDSNFRCGGVPYASKSPEPPE